MTVAKRFATLLTMCVVMAPAGVVAQMAPTDMTRRAVVTEKAAYIAMPPELVAEPVVTRLSVSSGRRYALAQRTRLQITADMLKPENALTTRPQGEVSLVLWDSRAHLSTTVWRADPDEMHIDQLTWLTRAEVAFVQLQQTVPIHPDAPQGEQRSRQILLRIAPLMGRAEVIDLGDHADADMLELIPSPTLPLSIVKFTQFISGGRDRATSLVLLDERGQFGAHADMPQGEWVSEVAWSETGEPLIQTGAWTPDKKHVTTTWSAMNTRTGELTPLANEPKKPQDRPDHVAQPKPVPALPLRLKSVRVPVKEEETTQTAGLLWLESVTQSEQPRILLSSDSTGGELMARAEMALFQSQGAVWATPLLPMDRAAYLVMKQKADRALVMSRAKQAALALLMYTQDYDDTLPDGDGLLDKLLPYAKDASIFDGFNYTYPGGPLADIASPAETVIGTMNGPGGHAVIYVDGHVRWQ
jgi:hypothetical protein